MSRESPRPGKRRTSEDLEGSKPPPAPDNKYLESNRFFQERAWLWSVCVHEAQSEHAI